MKRIKLAVMDGIGKELTRDELKNVFGGTGSGSGPSRCAVRCDQSIQGPATSVKDCSDSAVASVCGGGCFSGDPAHRPVCVCQSKMDYKSFL